MARPVIVVAIVVVVVVVCCGCLLLLSCPCYSPWSLFVVVNVKLWFYYFLFGTIDVS